MKRLMFFCVLFCCWVPVVFAQCVEPKESMTISADTVFCSGNYQLAQGMDVTANNVQITCQQTVFQGQDIGYGLKAQDVADVTINGCSFADFEVGVYVQNAQVSIENSVFTNNKFGIAHYESGTVDGSSNTFSNNVQDQLRVQSEVIGTQQIVQEEFSPKGAITKQIKVSNPDKTPQQIQQAVEGLLNSYQDDLVSIHRSFDVNPTDKSTTVTLTITPATPVEDVRIYDSIPKCVTQYVNQIAFTAQNYEVIEQDPLIMWSFPTLTEPRQISYLVFSEIEQECRELFDEYVLSRTYVADAFKPVVKQSDHAYYFGVIMTIVVALFSLVFFGGRIIQEIKKKY